MFFCKKPVRRLRPGEKPDPSCRAAFLPALNPGTAQERYFSNHPSSSFSRVMRFAGLPLLESSWFSPWNSTSLASVPRRFTAENIWMASPIQHR